MCRKLIQTISVTTLGPIFASLVFASTVNAQVVGDLRVDGRIEIFPKDSSVPIVLEDTNYAIVPGDRLVTDQSVATLIVPDTGRLGIAPESSVMVSPLDAGGFGIEIGEGSVVYSLRSGRTVRLMTPEAELRPVANGPLSGWVSRSEAGEIGAFAEQGEIAVLRDGNVVRTLQSGTEQRFALQNGRLEPLAPAAVAEAAPIAPAESAASPASAASGTIGGIGATSAVIGGAALIGGAVALGGGGGGGGSDEPPQMASP